MLVQTHYIKNSTLDLSWSQASDETLTHLFDRIQEVYQNTLSAGYVISFLENPSDGIQVDCYGTRKEGESLPQLAITQNNCLFCTSQKNTSSNPRILKVSQDFFSIQSLSNQVLFVPHEHHAHWFETPRHLQLLLFKEALSLREKEPQLIKRNIELHCGSPAGQTVAHLHLRSGIYSVK